MCRHAARSGCEQQSTIVANLQRHVRIYDLATRQLEKKLNPSAKWISSIDVHPGGDNLLLGSYDKRLCWFDLDLSSTSLNWLSTSQPFLPSQLASDIRTCCQARSVCRTWRGVVDALCDGQVKQ